MWESVIRRRPTLSHLALLERTQWASADYLRAFQCDALTRLIDHAYRNVPLYRARLDAAGARPQDVRTPESLAAALPILTREDVRDDGGRLRSRAAPFATIRKYTSGTSGHPIVLGYDASSEHWRQAIKLRAYAWAGYRPGDRVVFFWGVHSALPSSRAHTAKVALDRFAKRETYVPCAFIDDATLWRVYSVLRARRPEALVCYATAGAELARFLLRQGLRCPGMHVLCGAEPLHKHDREDLERAFGPHVYDTYGCREVMLIGSECEARDGLHVSMENLIVEIVVRGTDGGERAALPGECGEVVVTDLHNFGMPLIRYATGDIAVAGPRSACACGRALARIGGVEGRASDTLRDVQGNRINGVALSFVVFEMADAVRRFQFVQESERSVALRIVPGAAFGPKIITELRARCAHYLAGFDVRIELVDDLPRSPAGKHRLVIGATARR